MAVAARTDLNRTDLVALADSEVWPVCKGIFELAGTHAAELLKLGTTAEDIAAAGAAIETYKSTVVAPRVAISQDKTTTETIATLLHEIDGIFELRLDRTMRKFEAKNKAFFDDYTNARIIVDLGSRQKPAEPVPAPAVAVA
jgi:hypothetical protein